jgi:hypothetical protein
MRVPNSDFAWSRYFRGITRVHQAHCARGAEALNCYTGGKTIRVLSQAIGPDSGEYQLCAAGEKAKVQRVKCWWRSEPPDPLARIASFHCLDVPRNMNCSPFKEWRVSIGW